MIILFVGFAELYISKVLLFIFRLIFGVVFSLIFKSLENLMNLVKSVAGLENTINVKLK